MNGWPKSIPSAFHTFFENSKVLLVGRCIKSDCTRLRKAFNTNAGRMLDLFVLSKDKGFYSKSATTKCTLLHICLKVLGKGLIKESHLRKVLRVIHLLIHKENMQLWTASRVCASMKS